MDTMEHATFRYDTVEVENGLKTKQEYNSKIAVNLNFKLNPNVFKLILLL